MLTWKDLDDCTTTAEIIEKLRSIGIFGVRDCSRCNIVVRAIGWPYESGWELHNSVAVLGYIKHELTPAEKEVAELFKAGKLPEFESKEHSHRLKPQVR
jgi:hypothetical protein